MKQRLYSYKFLEDKGVIEQLEDFSKAVDDLENIDVSIGDKDKALLLLNALPKSYDQLRDAILYGRERTITLLEVQSALRAKELQKDGQKFPDAAAESLNIKNFKAKKFKKKVDDFKSVGNDKKETRPCHWCKKPGHLKKDCYDWKRKQAAMGNQNANTSDCTRELEVPEILNVMEISDEESWIMDSGCSFHMCPNLDWFDEINESAGSVILGNDQVCEIKGIGSVRLKMHDGSFKILSDVRYIPDVKRNLISLGLLETKGCSFTSSDGQMVVRKGDQIIMQAGRIRSLYYLLAKVIKGLKGETNAMKPESLRIWHMRLGHPADGSLKELIKRGLVTDCDNTDAEPC